MKTKIREDYCEVDFNELLNIGLKSPYDNPYGMLDILIAYGNKIPENLLCMLEKLVDNHNGINCYIDFEKVFVKNYFLFNSACDAEDAFNIPIYERELQNLVYIHKSHPKLIKGLEKNRGISFYYHYEDKKCKSFFVKMRRVLLECFAQNADSLREITKIFKFLPDLIDVIKFIDPKRYDSFFKDFEDFLVDYLDDSKYFEVDMKTWYLYFEALTYVIGPIVRTYKRSEASTAFKKKAYKAVQPAFDKVHSLLNTTEKLYDFMYTVSEVNIEENSTMIFMIFSAYEFELHLDLSNEKILKILLNMLDGKCDLVVDQLSRVDSIYINPEGTLSPDYERVIWKIIQFNNEEVMIEAYKKGLFCGVDFDQIILELKENENFIEVNNILPCAIAIRAKEGEGLHDQI